MRRTWLVAMVMMVSVCATSALGAQANLLFHASFDGRLEAATAKGDPKAKFLPPADDRQAQPRFAAGVAGGQALDIGTGARIVYTAKGNLDDRTGTLSFWTRRIGARPDGRYTFHLAGWSNGDGTRVRIYRWLWHGGVTMLHGRGGSGDVGLTLGGDADDGQWHFLAFTWDGNRMQGFLNGRAGIVEKADFPASHFTQLLLGGGKGPARLIDELVVFDAPLAPAEIEALYRTQLAGKPLSTMPAVPLDELVRIRTAHYPTAGILKVMLDAGRLRNAPLERLAFRVALGDGHGNVPVELESIFGLPDYHSEWELDVRNLEPGQFTAQCVVADGDQSIVTKKLAYEKRPLPEWYGNRVGITEGAPKPFTPLQRQGDTLNCWGREYRYADRLFPAHIVSQGKELLARPIELILIDHEGKEHRLGEAAVGRRWGRHSDFRLEFQRHASDGPVSVAAECWLECDGFLWTTLRVGSRLPIRRLALRVPLRKDRADYINRYDYSTRSTGKLAPEGWQGDARPVWLGGPEGGLQFTTETLAPCRLAEKSQPLRIVPQADATIFEVVLVDEPTVLSEPLEVSWGWVATPVRPPTPGYRGWLTGNGDFFPGYQWYVPKGTDFDPRWLKHSRFLSTKPRPDGQGLCTTSAGPYCVPTRCAMSNPDYHYWGDEWSNSRLGRGIISEEGVGGACSVAARSWEDYFVWCYRRLYDRGRFRGLYFDCGAHLPDDNTYHGAGYRKGDKVLPTSPVLAGRRLAQRMYVMLRELEPEQTMVLWHHSGQVDMAFLSWCDVYVDGENFTSRLTPQEPDYHRHYPVDAFLAQSMGHNLGPTVWFLDEFNRSHATRPDDWKRLGVQPVTHLYGLILLHDSTYWKAYGNPEGYRLVDEALRKYHFDERYALIPYWRQKVVALPEKVFATFYVDRTARTVLAVFLNNSEEDQRLQLQPDWSALGLAGPGRLTVDDAVFHGDARLEGHRLIVPIGRANMRLLAIRPTKE